LERQDYQALLGTGVALLESQNSKTKYSFWSPTRRDVAKSTQAQTELVPDAQFTIGFAR
jgi:hypothetical protein